jgi:3-keto-disaccharide hydrolase
MRKTLLPILAALFAVNVSWARETPLSFAKGWELEGEGTKVETFMGRSALRMRTGRAIQRDVRFQDGTIELDVLTTGHRSFFYVQFRMASDEEHEELYFRPHKSDLPDAIQYTPIYHGEGNWQLYHGDGATAFANFPRNQWTHIKIVVSGARVAVFVGGVATPQLVVPKLARASVSSGIALRSFLPGGKPADVYPTSFSNVVVRPGEVDYDFPPVEAEAPPLAGTVSEWLFSQPYATPDGPVRELPSGWKESRWSKLAPARSGLIVIGKYFERPQANKRATVLAKLRLTSDRDRRVPVHLGYSDEITVFLNGAPLFTANDSYSFDRPRREGLIEPDQAVVYLPLVAGDNELVLAVTDVFGGWGLMGRLEASGSPVTVSAR